MHGSDSIGSLWTRPGLPEWVYLEIFESAFSTFPGVFHVAEHESGVRFARHRLDQVAFGQAGPDHFGELYLAFFESVVLTFPWVSGRAEHESQVRFAQGEFDRVQPGQVVSPCVCKISLHCLRKIFPANSVSSTIASNDRASRGAQRSKRARARNVATGSNQTERVIDSIVRSIPTLPPAW